MINLGIPTNELNIKWTTDDTVYFYGLDINLSQADLPYIIPKPGERWLASPSHFAVYGDTVTLNGYLANPGKDIRICARKIIYQNGAFIDNAGPDPVKATDYDPDIPAQQTDEQAGAAGAAGATGGNGVAAGKVVLMAENMEGTAGKTPGPVRIDNFDMLQKLSGLCAKWLVELKQRTDFEPLGLSDAQVTVPGFEFIDHQSLAGSFQIKGLSCKGLKSANLDIATWDHGVSQAILRLSVKNLSVSGTGVMALNNQSLPAFPIHFTTSNITIMMEWSFDPHQRTFAPCQVKIKALLNFEYNLDQFGFISIEAAKIKLGLTKITNEVIATTNKQLESKLTEVLKTVPLSSIFEAVPDLFILNRGGRGGRGQDGHQGVQGKIGDKGKESDSEVGFLAPPPAESIGGKGAAGGQGGDAGKSGSGGPGGEVCLGFINAALENIAYDNHGGDGGPAAAPGSGGPGGNGGPPGSYLTLVFGDGQLPHYERVPSKSGPAGDLGPAASFQGKIGGTGSKGSISVNGLNMPDGVPGKLLTYEGLAPFMKVEQLLITQRAAEFAYLNALKPEDFEYVIRLAQWLVKITGPMTKSGFTPPADWDQHDIDTAKSIYGNAAAMTANYRQGLDFFGNHTNWVPILTLKSYQDRITQLINLGTIIENQFRAYLREKATAQEKLAALDQAREKMEDNIRDDQAEINNLADQINKMNASIDDLAFHLEQKQALMIQDQDIFKKEVRQYAEDEFGCNFKDILTGATDILKIAGSENSIEAITGVLDFMKDIVEWDEKYKNMMKIIETADANLEDLKKGVANVEKAIQTPEERGLVATNKQKFDEFVKKYIDKISVAPEFKDAVDQFFDLIDARNQAICSYNALYVKRAKVQANIDQTISRLEKIAALRQQQVADPSLPVYTSFMQQSYTNLKTVIIKKLYEENRALWYWSLEETPFSASDLSMATLSDTHYRIAKSIDEQETKRGGPFQPYSEEIRITAVNNPLAFRALPGVKKLVFSLPVTLPAFLNQYQVIANEFKLEFPDIQRETGVLFLTLTHSGASCQLPASGEPPLQFIHLPRVVSYKIDYANPHDTGGGKIGSPEEGYIGLSPFTTWTLNFDHPGNEFLDLHLIQSVVITFSGTYLGPPSLLSNFR